MSNEQGEQLPGGRGTITVVEIAGPPPNHLDVIARRKADQRASMARGRAAAALAKQRNDWWRCPNGHSASGNLCALCDATRAEAVPVRVAPDEIPVEGVIEAGKYSPPGQPLRLRHAGLDVPVIGDASLRRDEFRLVQNSAAPTKRLNQPALDAALDLIAKGYTYKFERAQLPYIPSCVDPLDRLVHGLSVRGCLSEYASAQQQERRPVLTTLQLAAARVAWADQLRTTKREHQERERMRVVLDYDEDF